MQRIDFVDKALFDQAVKEVVARKKLQFPLVDEQMHHENARIAVARSYELAREQHKERPPVSFRSPLLDSPHVAESMKRQLLEQEVRSNKILLETHRIGLIGIFLQDGMSKAAAEAIVDKDIISR